MTGRTAASLLLGAEALSSNFVDLGEIGSRPWTGAIVFSERENRQLEREHTVV